MRDIQLEYEPITNNLYNQMITSLTSLFVKDLEDSNLLTSLEDVVKDNPVDRKVH